MLSRNVCSPLIASSHDLTCIQGFKAHSEAERTASLYTLLTQVQIRFFVTVLQLVARADGKTALLNPPIGSSMQSRMEAKLG